jgi:DNA-binding MarR family transcriptional regulator
MSTPKTSGRTPARTTLLTDIILLIFRLNGQLLAAGDRLVGDLKLTSARWQMLGAVALSDRPRTAPQLGAHMGVTRQAAQKQLDLLMDDGLVASETNPAHARSPMYVLTRKGRSVYSATERLQTAWANQLSATLSMGGLETAKRLLEDVSGRLNRL